MVAVAVAAIRSNGAPTRLGDHGATTVGADHEPGGGVEAPAVPGPSRDARHPAAGSRVTSVTLDAVTDVCAGLPRRVDEHRVEDGAPRCVQRVDAVRRLDGTATLAVGVAEHVRRTGGVPAATMRSSSPHRWSCSTAARIRAWVDSVSAP